MSINLSDIYSSHKVLYASSEENFKSFNVLTCFIRYVTNYTYAYAYICICIHMHISVRDSNLKFVFQASALTEEENKETPY